MSDDSDSNSWVLASRKNARQIEKINSCLQETNRNLLALDKQLKQTKEMSKEKAARNEMLMEDLALSSKRLREEKQKISQQALEPEGRRDLNAGSPSVSRRRHHTFTAPFAASEGRGVESDLEWGRQSRPDVSVRFFDDMDAGRHLHSLHQSIRDLGEEQKRLQNELQTQRRSAGEINQRSSTFPSSLQIKKEVEEMVAKRLEAMRNERNEERIRNKQIEIGISSELKQALSRLNQGDAETRQSPTLNMMKDYQKQLSKTNEDNRNLKLLVSQLQQEIRNLKQTESDKARRQEEREEMQRLRAELANYSALAVKHNLLRQELEASDKQRMQISDLVEVLRKELEDKEKYERHILQQLQEAVDKQREAETIRQYSLSTQRDLESHLSEAKMLLQSSAAESNELRAELQASAKKLEDIKDQAQETVELWKQKNQKLENIKDLYEEAKLQNDRLKKEIEQMKSSENVSAQSVDKLKRDFRELFSSNAKLNEQAHLKDVQLNELVAVKVDLAKDLMDRRSIIERLENELHVANEKICVISQARNLLEDQLHTTHSSKLKTESIVQHLQRELSDVVASRKDIIAQNSQLKADKQDLFLNLENFKQTFISAKDDAICVEQRLKDELNQTLLKLEAAQIDASRLKDTDSGKIKELMIRLKKDEAEYSAEVQASKLEIDEQRATIRLQKKQIAAFQEEVKRLTDAIARSEDENGVACQQIAKMRQQFLANSFLTEDGLSHGKDLELQLLDSREEIEREKKKHLNILHKVAEEVESLVATALGQNIKKFKILTTVPVSDGDSFLMNLQNSLDCIKAELHEKQTKESQFKVNLQDAIVNSEKDRRVLMAEFERQTAGQVNGALPARTGALVNTDRQSPSKNRQYEQQHYDAMRPSNLPNTFDKERDEIHRRYEKQQDAVNFLKQELSNMKLFPKNQQATDLDIPTRDLEFHRADGHYYVNSADDFNLRSLSSNAPKKTVQFGRVSPLHLSDEEFRTQFLKPTSLVTAG